MNTWTADECPDANGAITIRPADGTPNGDTDAQPIATVYDSSDSPVVAAAPELADALVAIRRMLPRSYQATGLRQYDATLSGDEIESLDALLRRVGRLS